MNHYEMTKEAFIRRGLLFTEKEEPNGSHVLILKDNGEVWFYYNPQHELLSVRAY